jgi:hypothetical protein
VGDDDRLAVDVGDVVTVGGRGDERRARADAEQADEDQSLEQPPVAPSG